MTYTIKVTEFFLEQLKKLDKKSKRVIKNKIELIKINPFRYKRIHSRKFSRIFRVRLNLRGKEVRLIYLVLGKTILFVCLLERKREYRDLEKYLKKI